MRSEEMICRALDIDLRDYWTLLGAQSCDTLDNQVTHTSLKNRVVNFPIRDRLHVNFKQVEV